MFHGKYPLMGNSLYLTHAPGVECRTGDHGVVVSVGGQRFGYWRDPVGLAAAAAYALNRWLVPLAWQAAWWRGHFADVLLIPAGLPWWLWLEKGLGWRGHDTPPRWSEIAFLFVVWSAAAELIGPHLFRHATADAWDVVAYAAGAVAAGVLWRPREGRHEF